MKPRPIGSGPFASSLWDGPLDEPLWRFRPQYELPRRPTEHLKAVLGRVLRADQIKTQARLADVDQAWRGALAACAPAQAEQAIVRGLRRGVLHVGVTSSAALCELKGFREQELLARLQAELPRRAIRSLRFTVLPSAEPPRDGPPPPEEDVWE